MSFYTTSEEQGFVEICAAITEPVSGVAPRPFTLTASTGSGPSRKYFYEKAVSKCVMESAFMHVFYLTSSNCETSNFIY